MAWWNGKREAPAIIPRAITAAARAIEMGRERLTPNYDSWQREAWIFYDDLGEFRYAIDWRAEMVSRVRLRAGQIKSGQDEPEIQDTGPAAELIEALSEGAAGGESQLMRSFATQLGVVGECWLVGEQGPDGTEQWRVRSSDEIRSTRDTRVSNWEVLDDQKSTGGTEKWRQLAQNALVTRVWEPHPRKYHEADSPTRSARSTLRELELVNRHIQAGYLSRLAMAGVITIPSEIQFPVRPEFEDDPNPMVREWVETAKTAIATPGTAAAVVPIPMIADKELLDAIRFIPFEVPGDRQILEKRDSAIRRIATQLDLPAEVLLGMGDVNHWSAWQLEESGIKVHILPMVERICEALTTGYLEPRLKAAGIDPADWAVWYDASEITMRPDRSEQATAAYKEFVITEEAYRREVGMDEADAPSDEELTRMILLRLAQDPTNAPIALQALTGYEIEPVEALTPEPAVEDPQASPEVTGQNGPPDTQDEAPPAPDESAPAQAASAMVVELQDAVRAAQRVQSKQQHWLVKNISGWNVVHSDLCKSLKTPCPFDGALPPAMPGASGTYELALVDGRLRIGSRKQDSAYAHQRTQP